MLVFRRNAAIKKTADLLGVLKPALIIVPCHHDRHPDHIATYDIVTAAIKAIRLDVSICQYFVYSQRHILPNPNPSILHINISDDLEAKKSAISRFKTQITCISRQQSTAVLDSNFLQGFYSGEELFLSSRNIDEFLFPPVISTARLWLTSYKNRFSPKRKGLKRKRWNKEDIDP